jgi:hypothetical protein
MKAGRSASSFRNEKREKNVWLTAMGLEAKCHLRLGRDSFAGKAHLDSDKLTFRGGTKFDLAFKNIRSVTVRPEGELVLAAQANETLVLVLGDRATAEKWSLKIRHPKNLIDKLGVKPDSRVAVLGVTDGSFARQLKERLKTPAEGSPAPALDFIFYAADTTAELAKLNQLRKYLRPAGAIWVVSLKGKAATIKDTDVMRAARAAGLVDNKVCGFSATHTALKLVIPLAAR